MNELDWDERPKAKAKNADTPITDGERFVWDWQHGYLGDCFRGKLAELIAKSDTTNRSKLYKAFPTETQAITDYQFKEDWWWNAEEKIAIESESNKVQYGGYHDN